MSELIAEKREILGSKVAGLRADGFIPAELYGYGVDNTHLSVPVDKFTEIYGEAGSSTIVDVVVDGKKHKVLIHDVQVHPISREVLNVDFYQVNMKEKVKTHVPLEFINESPAVNDLNGVFLTIMDEVEVEALPSELPHNIEVDISVLVELDTSLSIGDLPKSDKYEYTAEPEAAVVSVSTPRLAEEEPEEEEEEGSVEDVVSETDEKAEAREGDEESGKEGNQDNDKT